MAGHRSLEYSHDVNFFSNGGFAEYLITDPSLAECTGFEQRGERSLPTFGNAPQRDPLRREIQRGVDEFVDDLFDMFGSDVEHLTARPAIAHRSLSQLVANPGLGDAQLFEHRSHDDEVGSNRGGVLGYWGPGRDVLDRER